MVSADALYPIACLQCLRPIGSLIVDMFGVLRGHLKSANRGTDLLVDMLPRRQQQQEKASCVTQETSEILGNTPQDPALNELSLTKRPTKELHAIELGTSELENGVAAVELRTCVKQSGNKVPDLRTFWNDARDSLNNDAR